MTVSLAPPTHPLRIDETGTIRVGKTRVTLDVFVEAYRSGETPESLAESYDSLSLSEIHAVIAYYLDHQDELDRYLIRREAEADQIRQIVEARQGPQPTRVELLARLNKT